MITLRGRNRAITIVPTTPARITTIYGSSSEKRPAEWCVVLLVMFTAR